MARVSLDIHAARMKTCFSFSLIVFLCLFDWSVEACRLLYFEEDWRVVINDTITLVEPSNVENTAECTLREFHLNKANTTAEHILTDCFMDEVEQEPITKKIKKCEYQSSSVVHISHFRCVVAKAQGLTNIEGCDHEKVCHLFPKAQVSKTVTSRPTSPAITSALSTTETSKLMIATTVPPPKATQLPINGNTDNHYGQNASHQPLQCNDCQVIQTVILPIACFLVFFLPLVVYIYMKRQIRQYEKKLGALSSLPMEEMQLPRCRQCSTTPLCQSQHDTGDQDVDSHCH